MEWEIVMNFQSASVLLSSTKEGVGDKNSFPQSSGQRTSSPSRRYRSTKDDEGRRNVTVARATKRLWETTTWTTTLTRQARNVALIFHEALTSRRNMRSSPRGHQRGNGLRFFVVPPSTHSLAHTHTCATRQVFPSLRGVR